MKEIPLTQGKVALVDDADYEAVMQFKWHAHKNKGAWYARRNARRPDGTRTTQFLHQFLMPGVPMIDHRDGDGLNNQHYNLRPCTSSQNQWNHKPRTDGTSKSKGVSWNTRDKKWQVDIWFKSRKYYLGYFDSEEDAARAYDTAARKFYGEFARLNFPELDKLVAV